MAKRASKVQPIEAVQREVDFHIMPPPRLRGLDELWRVADAGAQWAYIANLLRSVPKACEQDGVLEMLHVDLAECFGFLEQALRTGELPMVRDFRGHFADAVIECAQQVLEMDARGELAEHCGVGADALALLSSAREATAASKAAA